MFSPVHHQYNCSKSEVPEEEFPTLANLIYTKSKTIQIFLPSYNRKVLNLQQGARIFPALSAQ